MMQPWSWGTSNVIEMEETCCASPALLLLTANNCGAIAAQRNHSHHTALASVCTALAVEASHVPIVHDSETQDFAYSLIAFKSHHQWPTFYCWNALVSDLMTLALPASCVVMRRGLEQPVGKL